MSIRGSFPLANAGISSTPVMIYLVSVDLILISVVVSENEI